MPSPPTSPTLDEHEHEHEDELDPLPPLDGEERDESDPEGDFGDALEDDGEEASLDDATGEGEPADTDDLDVDEQDGGWLDEPPDAPDLDLGDLATADFGEEPRSPEPDPPSDLDRAREAEDAEPGVGEEDFGFGDAPERGDLDGGDDGPLDPDEGLSEEDLPALDADDDGEMDDAALIDAGFAADEPLGLPWAAEPWSRVGAPVSLVGATALVCAGRGALVAGRWDTGTAELLRMDLEGTWQAVGAQGLDVSAIRALSAEGDVVAAVVEGGRLFVSRDGGASFAAAPLAGGIAAEDVTVASGALWIRTRAGGLLVARDENLERCAVPGIVAGLARDATAGIAALVVDAAGRAAGIERALADGSLGREEADAPDAHAPAPFAVRREHVAYAARRGGVARRLGSDWAAFAWEGRVTALAFVDDAGTLVAATYSEADDATALVRIDAAGQASVVARLGAARADADTDGRVVAMAYDEARGVVWVAGGVGVAAFSVR